MLCLNRGDTVKLTQEQIETAMGWIGCECIPPEADAHLHHMVAAYQRVAEWVESGTLDAVITAHALPLDLREMVRGCRDDVRRALYGEG